MADLFDGGVHDKDTTKDKDAGRKVHAAFNDTGPIKDVERCGQRGDQSDHHKEQNDTQSDGDDNAPSAHRFLLGHGRALALDGDLK